MNFEAWDTVQLITGGKETDTVAHSSLPAWETPRPEEPGGPQSIGLRRVGHD